MEKTRILGFDIIRVLACYLVIQVHAGEYYYIGNGGSVITENVFWVGILNSLCRTAVPLFIMISGFFLLPIKDETGQFFRKRFTRVAIPFVVWCVLYAIYWALKGQTTWAAAALNILHIPVNFGTEIGHLWYVYMLIGLYLFIPIISPWIQSASRKSMHLYLILWAIALCLPYIHLVFPEILGECYWNNTPLLYYFSGFLGYMILSGYIKRFMSEKKNWHGPVALLLIAVGYLITAGGFISLTDTVNVTDLELTWGFETINVAMMSLGIFLLLKNIKPGKSTPVVNKGITDISLLSYGIYLVHIMILNFFFGLFDPKISSVVIKIPLIAVCTFIGSYAVIKLVSLLPKSKYIVG